MTDSCEKKHKMVENGVESEIKLGEPTMRDTLSLGVRCKVTLILTESFMITM